MLIILQDLSQILIWVLGIIIIGLVLLQGGAGDVSSAFGGGGQLDGALGVGANKKLAKITGALSFVFVVMIVILAMPREGDFTESESVVAPETESTEMAPPAEITPSTEMTPVVIPTTEAEVTTDEAAAPVIEAAAETPAETPEVEAPAAETPASESPTDGSGVDFGEEEEAEAPTETTP